MTNQDQEAAQILVAQNFTAAIVGGAVAAVIAAFAYGITVAIWPFAYGFAFAGIGIAVGATMQFLGRGIATRFAVAAAGLTLLACVLGYLMCAVVERGMATGAGPLDVLANSAFTDLVTFAAGYFSPVDIVYWFVALFCAVFLARRALSREQRLAVRQVAP